MNKCENVSVIHYVKDHFVAVRRQFSAFSSL